MTAEEIEEHRKKEREYEENKRRQMTEAETNQCRQKQRENEASKKNGMSEAEREEARKGIECMILHREIK